MKEEQLLIRRSRNGDRSAFRMIVEYHKKSVYYLALSMTGNHHDAEDISQEVFLKLYQSLNKIRGKAKLSTWLYRVTVNTCINKKRKKSLAAMKLQENYIIDEMGNKQNYEGYQSRNPEQYTESRRINMHIENALKRITHKERTVFVLRHYRDLPLKEIAGILSIAEGTVKSTLFRAIKKLQKELSFYTKEIEMENTK